LAAPKAAGRVAYDLFATPRRSALRPKEADFLATARQIKRRVDQHDIMEYHWGPQEGPLLLLSYGWAYNAGRWRHFVPDLVAAGFHVLAYDPPGHGASSGNKLDPPINSLIQRDLIAHYGPVAAVLAHSFGAASAVQTVAGLSADQRPHRMVVMATFSSASRLFSSYRHQLGLWKGVYREMIRAIEASVGDPIHAFDMARISGRISHVEALLVHDPHDRVTPFANALRYQAFWPGLALWRAPGGGHHLGKADITEVIIRFLVEGKLPGSAEIAPTTLPAGHDLVRYFAGMEI
jgi:pimeloyl-ACP methyl ester carboxylesterase